MNQLEEIRNWLNSSRDFDRGFMIYIAYINDKSLRYLLEQTRNEEKLFTALLARYNELKDQPSINQVPTNNSESLGQNQVEVIDTTELPEQLSSAWRNLKTEQERWHTEMCLIHEQHIISESHRIRCAQLAAMILCHENQLQELANAMNHFKIYGKIPEEFKLQKPDAPRQSISHLSDADKLKRLKNSIGPNISKLTKKINELRPHLSNLKGKALEKANGSLSKWEKQLALLEKEKEELLNAQ